MLIPKREQEDEIGDLIDTFNKTAIELINLRKHLEEEIALKTMDLKLRNDELSRLSFMDALTGIANRRRFEDVLKNTWDIALRNQYPIGLYMLDMDFFKEYNDHYGHLEGNECLKSIGRVLRSKAKRSSDLVARYGGEEFVFLIHNPELNTFFSFADSIRKSIEDLNIEHKGSKYGKITVSIGIAYMVPDIETTAYDLVDRADRALYSAKENGRNIVVKG